MLGGGGKGLCGLIMHIYFYLGRRNWSGIVEYSVENKYKRRLIILLFLLRRRLPYCYANNARFTHTTTIRHVQSPSPPSSSFNFFNILLYDFLRFDSTSS